jgi:hypothetical protein
MRKLHWIALAALLGLSVLGCASVTPPASRNLSWLPAHAHCRNVASPDGTIRSYCGSPEQWAEFDSRMAQVDQGLSCRRSRTSQPLCLFAKQWNYMDTHRTSRVVSFRDEAARDAMGMGWAFAGENAIYSLEAASAPPQGP